jgi:hypothetical protein
MPPKEKLADAEIAVLERVDCRGPRVGDAEKRRRLSTVIDW